MKQLIQSLKDGSTKLENVPAPGIEIGYNLIRTSVSLVSVGTERMLIEFGKDNIINKVRRQPDKVKMVIEKAKTDGILTTINAVKSKLDIPVTLGYCNVGTIIEANNTGNSHGQRVVSNGKHAEIVSVPKHLCAIIPDNVSDEDASFTVLAAIGLQGIRLAEPTLGECVVVIGLGLIGLLTVQMLRAQGCQVLGVDFDPLRLELARSFGAKTVNSSSDEDVLLTAKKFSKGNGVDAVIITASTSSNKVVSQAAKISRQRGRIILIGVVGLELNRSEFYEKELTFQVSCSYGPGRYDSQYEEAGFDYPIGFVRWTEQRNFEAVLEMMSTGILNPKKLISHRFDIERGEEAMNLLTSKKPILGMILNYHDLKNNKPLLRKIDLYHNPNTKYLQGKGSVAFVGAGNYASRVLIPAFRSAGANLHSIVSKSGVSALHFGKKFHFNAAISDINIVLSDPNIDIVVVATRHVAHAEQVISALKANKHVFCEKPLCLTSHELNLIIEQSKKKPNLHLMLGFNRRFSPQIKKMKNLLSPIPDAKSVVITVNAGEIPRTHWTQDPSIGGGRIIGEACHFIDLARHLIGHPIISYHVHKIPNILGTPTEDDKVSIVLTFEDGSIATIHYFANGHKSFPKERVEVFVSGRVLQLDNFIYLKGWGWRGFKSMRLWKQNKGQSECALAFLEAVKENKTSPIPKDEIFEVSRLSIMVAEAAKG